MSVITIFFMIFVLVSANVHTSGEQVKKTALLIIDVQNFYFSKGAGALVNPEAAIRAGHDYGFECIVVHDACATRALKFKNKTISAEDVHYSTLSTLSSYAKVINTETFLKEK
jgi:nicotinamidase-related amidase